VVAISHLESAPSITVSVIQALFGGVLALHEKSAVHPDLAISADFSSAYLLGSFLWCASSSFSGVEVPKVRVLGCFRHGGCYRRDVLAVGGTICL